MLGGEDVEGVFQSDVGVERIVLRRNLAAVVGVVEGSVHAGFLGEEFAELQVGGHAVLVEVIVAPFVDALLQSAETARFDVAREGQRSQVGELHVELGAGSPSAFVGVVLQTQLVDPYLHALFGARVVADTNHDGAYFADGGVAQDGNLVVGSVLVVVGEDDVVRSHAQRLLLVALGLDVGEDRKVDVHHVVFGPYGLTVGQAVGVVPFGRGHFQRHFVFIVIVLVVRTEADEYARLVVLERSVAGERVGVGKHLQVAILSEVQAGVLVNGSCIARREVLHGDVEGLLVVFTQLAAVAVDVARNARRQHVVHRCLVVVLFQAYGRHFQCAAGILRGVAVERHFVTAPFAAYQLERTEAQNDRLFKVGQIHSHEANAGEVGDVSDAALVLAQRYAEEVPVDGGLLSVAQGYDGLPAVDDVAHAHLHAVGAEVDAILVVVVVFVEGVVLVHVFGIGCGAVSRAVLFGRVLGVHRVTFGIVDAQVALQNGHLVGVEVASTVVVVVVAGRVGCDGVVNGGVHLAANLLQVLGVDGELGFLCAGQTVQTDVLARAGTRTGVEGVGHRRLGGHVAPQAYLVLGGVAVERHTAFVELVSVLQNVFADVSQVDVEVAGEVAGFFATVDEGVHHPEFDVFDVGRLKVNAAVVDGAHHTAPVSPRVVQLTAVVEVGVEVVRTALARIVGQVEHVERGRFAHRQFSVGEEFRAVHLANVVVRELFDVALDVARGE